jgi:hypothetical protein
MRERGKGGRASDSERQIDSLNRQPEQTDRQTEPGLAAGSEAAASRCRWTLACRGTKAAGACDKAVRRAAASAAPASAAPGVGLGRARRPRRGWVAGRDD